jgi:hypothetical protein
VTIDLTNPTALWLALLAVPIALLYLASTRPRRQLVATGFLWAQAVQAQRVRSWWRPWRQPVSLAVQLAVLALVVVATAGPAWDPAWLLAPALALVAIEWCLFHRRWTC